MPLTAAAGAVWSFWRRNAMNGQVAKATLPIEKAQGILLLEDTFESKTKEQIESALKTALGRLKIYLDVPQRSITYALACLPALAANIANATEHNALDKVFLVPKVVT